MKMTRYSFIAAAALALLAACGGGGGGDDRDPPVDYSRLVTFGDSLSDVGSYAVSGVFGTGGGKYTVNGPGVQIWVERLARAADVRTPCAAQTGLEATESLVGFPPAPVQDHPGCYGYAQGGARVTNPIGPGNKALLASGDRQAALGQLTKPLVEQMNRHLAATGGAYRGDELVTVLAGGNDTIINLSAVSAGTVTPTAAVQALGVAGAELAGYVRTLVVGKGAKYVVVMNLPDFNTTPAALAQSAQTRQLIGAMVAAYNGQLAAGLTGVPEVLLVDAFTRTQDQSANPANYGLTNVTSPACNPALAATSLICSVNKTVPGDVSSYAYADSVHPTPRGYELLFELTRDAMVAKGWL